jgi:hypothetical protein
MPPHNETSALPTHRRCGAQCSKEQALERLAIMPSQPTRIEHPGLTGWSATRLDDVTLSVQPSHRADSVDTDTPSGGGHNTGHVASKRANEPERAHACARKRDRSVAREPPSARPLQRRYPHKATSHLGPRSPRSERFRNDTPANQRNTCARRAPETLTYQEF